MRIALYQMNSIVGDFDSNVNAIIGAMHNANEQGAQLLVIPELALCGYYPYDLLTDPDFMTYTHEAIEHIICMSEKYQHLTTLFGTATLTECEDGGKPLFNSCLAIRDGKVIARYNKQLLPTYNIFDERRHFEPGRDSVTIEIDGYTIGLLICEDLWWGENGEYACDPIEALTFEHSTNLIISINASPSDFCKKQQRHAIVGAAASTYETPILYVNAVGGQDSLVFDGNSFAVNNEGTVIFEAAQFKDSLEYIDFCNNEFVEPITNHAVTYDSDAKLAYEQITFGLRDYMRKCGFTKVVVGCSGGVDSALTIALAAHAIGAANVTAITMPSDLSSEGSVSDSELLCAKLGVQLLYHTIGKLVTEYISTYYYSTATVLTGIARENVQPRIRGTILMEYSNMENALLLSTGNKSETSVGYCTLYGDTNGGLNLIGDLYKTEVYTLCAYVNSLHDCIPEDILTKEPSAELAEGQKDTDSLPDYETSDTILKFLIEGTLLSSDEYLYCRTFVESNSELTTMIKSMIARNEYKRRQAPPIIRLRPRAFGSGRQMPIAARYRGIVQ